MPFRKIFKILGTCTKPNHWSHGYAVEGITCLEGIKHDYMRWFANQNTMDDILDKIAVKQKQYDVEKDPELKDKYRKQLMVLRLRNEIAQIQQQLKT